MVKGGPAVLTAYGFAKVCESYRKRFRYYCAGPTQVGPCAFCDIGKKVDKGEPYDPPEGVTVVKDLDEFWRVVS
mgnify:CR=1